MATANARSAGAANGAVPPVDGAVPVVNGAALPQLVGARVRAAGQAAAPVAVALFPPALAPARFDVEGALLGPMPKKSNGSCEILPKISG